MTTIKPGERRTSKWKKRTMVAVQHHHPDGPRGGKVSFYFADEGPQPFEQRMAYQNWINYPIERTRA